MKMKDIATVQRELMYRINTEGVEAAYEAALAICKDPKAPAPAKATASASLFRVAGFFEKRDGGASDKPLSEMSPEEINAEISRIRSRLDDDQDQDADIFG